jgi:hypothetical protein
MQLGNILAGEARGAGHPENEASVEYVEVGRSSQKSNASDARLGKAAHERLQSFPGLGSGDADDRDTGFAWP